MNILVVEDDTRLAMVLKRGLSRSGHIVDCVHDGISGREYADAGTYDAMIFDVMLPGLDGLSLVRHLRRAGNQAPILFLTARDTVAETIAGLDAGANDYMRKPFHFGELDARLRSMSRATAKSPSSALAVGDLTLDPISGEVRRAGIAFTLTMRELAFLEYFMRNARRVVTRAMIDDALWERDTYTESNITDVYIYRLRSKLQIDGREPIIRTIRGLGYQLG